MRLNFRQGLITSEVDVRGNPNYLTMDSAGVTLRTANRSTTFTVADGTKNYTIGITTSVLGWPLALFQGVSVAWLYVDINKATSARTFSLTLLQPVYSNVAPVNPVNDQHWFDLVNKTMKVYNSTSLSWLKVTRLIVGKFAAGAVECIPFGSSAGIAMGGPFVTGEIVVDGLGKPLKDSTGLFLTTEDTLVVAGAPTYAASIDNNLAISIAAENIPAYHVVAYNEQGQLRLANYNDVGEANVGIVVEPAATTEAANVVLNGKVTNPNWDWAGPNVTLWVSTSGTLVDTDPYTTPGFVTKRAPVARTIDATTIVFTAGLGTALTGEQGGVGEPGPLGPPGPVGPPDTGAGIQPEAYGAIGSGIDDDSIAFGLFIDACLSTGQRGRCTHGAKYRITTALTRTLSEGQIFEIDMNGASVVQGWNNIVLNLINSPVGPITPATEIVQASVNLGNGNTNTQVMQITSPSHPFTAIGQIGKVFSDDLVPDNDGQNQFCGEFFTVGKIIDSNTFVTTGIFDETYLTNPKVVRPSNARVSVNNLSGESTWQDNITSSFVNIQGFLSPKFQNAQAREINAAFLNLTSNYKPMVHGIVGRNLKNRPDLGAYGYLVNDSAGYYGDISGIDCIYARHSYTTSTPTSSQPNDDKWWLRGRTIGTTVSHSTAQGCHNAFDTHSPALRIRFVDCTPIDDFRGNDTGGAGIQIRANDCEVINCNVTNSKIGIAQSGASKSSDARLVISGLKYTGPTGHSPVVINGSPNYSTVVNFDGGNISSKAASIFTITNASVTVRDTNVVMSPTDNGSSLVKLNAGASVDWQGGSVLINAANTHKIIEHAETNTVAYVDGLRIKGVTGRLAYLATSAAQYAIESRFTNIQVDAPLGAPFLGQPVTLPKVSAQYVVNYNNRPLAYRVYVFNTAGNQAIDLQFAGDDSIFVRVEAQIAGVVINSLTQGAFAGQRLIINNRNTSTASVVIANSSAGLLLMGTSATLTAGRGITLVWDGSNWRSAAMH